MEVGYGHVGLYRCISRAVVGTDFVLAYKGNTSLRW